MKHHLLIFSAFLFIFSSCEKEDKPEYVDDNRMETTPQQVKEKDTVKTEINKLKEENSGLQSKETPAAVISPLNAGDYIGKYVTVKGFVADVFKNDKVAYLNFVKRFPDNPFSGVIFARSFEEFGDPEIYSGKNVEITGRVSVYHDKPQMILEKKSQIKIVD